MKRVILLVVCILTIGILVGGNIYWGQKVKATAEKAMAALNQGSSSTKESTESKSTDKDTDSNSSSQSSDDKTNSKSADSTKTTNEDSKSSTEDGTNNEDKQKSVAEIKKEYNPLFSELEAQETSKVDQLVVEAKSEYVSKKSSKTEISRQI